jgi:hypothetical protein
MGEVMRNLLPNRLLLTTLLGVLLCNAAWGRLGGDLASVQADQQAWAASIVLTRLGSTTLYAQTLPDGQVVRQYVDAAGLVFAVGWEGTVLPDFERLLGPHFAAYRQALRQQKRGVSVQNAEVVIESGGMMRSFAGRAYLPAHLPATLTAQDIR